MQWYINILSRHNKLLTTGNFPDGGKLYFYIAHVENPSNPPYACPSVSFCERLHSRTAIRRSDFCKSLLEKVSWVSTVFELFQVGLNLSRDGRRTTWRLHRKGQHRSDGGSRVGSTRKKSIADIPPTKYPCPGCSPATNTGTRRKGAVSWHFFRKTDDWKGNKSINLGVGPTPT